MTIREALENAITLLETEGVQGSGDIHDDLRLALNRLLSRHPRVANEEL